MHRKGYGQQYYFTSFPTSSQYFSRLGCDLCYVVVTTLKCTITSQRELVTCADSKWRYSTLTIKNFSPRHQSRFMGQEFLDGPRTPRKVARIGHVRSQPETQCLIDFTIPQITREYTRNVSAQVLELINSVMPDHQPGTHDKGRENVV